MLWKPATRGEEMFLAIHNVVGNQIGMNSKNGTALDYLYSENLFTEFSQYVATIEVFLRCVRRVCKEWKEHPNCTAASIGATLRREEGLPPSLCQDPTFCQVARLTGKIVSEARRLPALEKASMDAERRDCYICGVEFSDQKKQKRTADHIWPLSMGGETIEENILPACEDCNEKQGHAITWAWWPIQSAYYKHNAGKEPPGEFRLSLAIARIMMEASGKGNVRGKTTTLKAAARRIWPAVPVSDYDTSVPLVYFEMLKKVGA